MADDDAAQVGDPPRVQWRGEAPAMSRKGKTKGVDALHELRAFGLAYPAAHTKSPWPGHLDLAVRDKTFAYMSVEGEPLSISCKLPHSWPIALKLAFTSPTGYGLGKSSWVTATFADGEQVPIELLKAWIDESYRAQAPKRLVATLGPSLQPPGST
jgi:predicted DNA-binding protein (MmcQ/YjbR family)